MKAKSYLLCAVSRLSMTFWGQVRLGHNDKLVTLALMYAHKEQNIIVFSFCYHIVSSCHFFSYHDSLFTLADIFLAKFKVKVNSRLLCGLTLA